MTTTTTEADILALLAGIDEKPDDWRARTLILADACRELGRDTVADALADYAENMHTVRAGGRAVLRAALRGARNHNLPRRERRWVSRMIRDAR